MPQLDEELIPMVPTVSRPVVLDGPASPPCGFAPAQPSRTRQRRPHAQLLASVLTARPLTAARPDVVAALRAAHYDVRVAPSWQRLLDAGATPPVDVVLVDLDHPALDERAHPRGMSGHRLVSLLAHRAQVDGFALVLQTACDYSEIEDLVRQGVQALVRPDDPTPRLIATINAALRHRAACRGRDRA
jgi:DNA-binding NarL/FixJ family response regulator